MEIHQLRYFVAVAETGNFTRAAERCNVSQPSLSQQIINLESELGHKLFHRLGRKAVLTESGELFIGRARRVLHEVEAATREIKDAPTLERRITVGAIPTVMPHLMTAIIGQALQKHPDLIIHAREDFRPALVKSVLEGDLDMALVSMPVTDTRIAVEALFTEPLLLAVSKTHPLATQPTVSGDDLRNETFALLGHSSALAAKIQGFCGAHDFEPMIGYRCSQIATVKSFVAMGLGISILPQLSRVSGDDSRIVYRDLSGRAPTREIALIRHPQRYQSRGASLFIETLRESIKPLATDGA
ncbi:LysR family hydrogen peroxide-inducible transcriptional activator [Ereboglobus sp. PH5-10]|uniref:LysR family transcriptional regulator n=1 Tax=Ereboglobus sp. PH5-10 TaxID=2940629 RepID=UPI00240601C1|nr:LysR family transcriptional regulator [Ereboglobus sp. PH5-10]MDF9828239.1 LysR family hydrogen peroxide-inducible transcriptional activator [Ereboglobus sp. PH5-10]